MVIAIDGPSGVGKSSIAKYISDKLGIYYLNSGNFYRAITLQLIKNGLDSKSHDDRMKACKMSVFDVIDGQFYLNGENVNDKLHTRAIDMEASYVSVDPDVRSFVNEAIHKLTESMSIICEGRDMTTVVFPNAEYKFYFDAEPEIRAERRFKQKPDGLSKEEILAEINKRDENDKNKPVGSLKIAEDAVYIDTSYLTIDEVCAKVLNTVNNK